jgi:hypothetical protein
MASRLQDVILRGTAAARPAATAVAPGTLYYSTDTNTTDRCADTGLTWETYADGGTGSAAVPNTGLCQGRLTTETGVAVSTSDRTAQATIYYTPYEGNRVALYSGSAWAEFALTERSLALSGLTSGKNYDVFLYNNSGTLTLELSAAWASDTARTDALTTQDGVTVKSGATTRRLVGTIRTTGTTTTEDSEAKRFVWSATNRVPRYLRNVTETANSWTYMTATFRQANANTANQLDYVVGLNDRRVEAVCRAARGSTTIISAVCGIGVDSTSVNSGHFHGGGAVGNLIFVAVAAYTGHPGIGRHTLVWLEYADVGGTTTWYGDANTPTIWQSGISGTVWG